MFSKGELIERIRREKNIPIETLALKTGIAAPTVTAVCKSKVEPYKSTFLRYLKALDATGDEIIDAALSLTDGNDDVGSIEAFAIALDAAAPSLGCTEAFMRKVGKPDLEFFDVIITSDLSKFILDNADGIRLSLTNSEIERLTPIIKARSDYFVYVGGQNA